MNSQHLLLISHLRCTKSFERWDLAKVGINFDAKVRRTSFKAEDLILAHIAGMDTYARALKGAAAIIEDKFLSDIVDERYTSYKNTEVGQSIENGTATFESFARICT